MGIPIIMGMSVICIAIISLHAATVAGMRVLLSLQNRGLGISVGFDDSTIQASCQLQFSFPRAAAPPLAGRRLPRQGMIWIILIYFFNKLVNY